MTVVFALPGDPAERKARAEVLEPVVVRNLSRALTTGRCQRLGGFVIPENWETHRLGMARLTVVRLRGFVGRWAT